MGLTSAAIKRPITTTMITLAFLLFGGLSIFRIPLDLLPDVDFPVITVETRISGYSPSEVENAVTKPLEAAVGIMNHVHRVGSVSREGVSLVQIEFQLGTNMDYAFAEVREKVNLIRDDFPRDARNPHVRKYNPSEAPIMAVAVRGPRDSIRLRQMVEEKFENRLKRIKGVGNVEVKGGRPREIIVELDHGRLHALGLSVKQVADLLEKNNLNLQIGAISEGSSRLIARAVGEYQSLAQIEDMGIGRTSAGSVVSIREIGRVTDWFGQEQSLTRFQGDPRVVLTIQKESGANTIQVSRALKKELEEPRDEWGENLQIEIIYDQADFIQAAVTRLRDAALWGGLLAMAVIFLFLRNLQSILVIGLAIPLSIVAALSLIHSLGITLNIISLSGFTLGVGMLVDNAIVVIENIFKKRQSRSDAAASAVTATREVGKAITMSTIAHIAVFLPVIFLQQKIRMLYSGLFFTVSFSLLASLLVALTVVPLIASKIGVKPLWSGERQRPRAGRRRYRRLLIWSLRNRGKVIVGGVLLFAGSLFLLPRIGFEPMARVDKGVFHIIIRTPPGTRLSVTDKAARDAERILLNTAEVSDVSAEVTEETAQLRVRLVPEQERTKTTREIVEFLRPKMASIPSTQTHFDIDTGTSTGNKIGLEVEGYDQEKLMELASDIKERLLGMEGFSDVVIHQGNPKPELQIKVLHDKAGAYGLDAARISEAVRSKITGPIATEYLDKGREIDIRVRLQREDIRNFSVLEDMALPVLSDEGEKVLLPLQEVCTFRFVQGMAEIHRKDQHRMIRVTGDIGKGDLGRTAERVRGELQDFLFPEGYGYNFSRDYHEMKENQKEMIFSFVLAVLLVYMILASLFESFLYPLIIIFSVPMAVLGSIIVLYLTGMPINIPVYVGAITLAGIVVNNAVVLVDYIQLLKSRGLGKWRAVVRGAESRLRPILMTSGTTLLALFPMAIDKGEGANLWSPLALTIMGGLASSTLLTLIILPLLSSFIEERRR
jgi:hydrophobic/amphiphilic exporter-1 (mainly G- bacteria), HAE1 family